MKKNRILFLVSLISVVLLNAGSRELLYNYQILEQPYSNQVFHLKSSGQFGGWTCGFFTLNNAKIIDELLGLQNNYRFKDYCLPYLQETNLDPTKGITNIDLVELAETYLSLPDFYVLHENKEKNIELMTAGCCWDAQLDSRVSSISMNMVQCDLKKVVFSIRGPYNATRSQIERAVTHELHCVLDKKMKDLAQRLKIKGSCAPARIHFGCIFEEHIVLMSVVKYPGEDPIILILDNLNACIMPGSVQMKFIEYLHRNFCC